MIMMYEGPHHRVCTFLLLTLLLLDSSIENWAAISDQSENPSIHPSVKKGCHQFCETKQILDSLDYLQDNFIQWWCFPSFWPAWKYLSEEKKTLLLDSSTVFFLLISKVKTIALFPPANVHCTHWKWKPEEAVLVLFLKTSPVACVANLYQKGKQQQFWKDKTFSLRLIDFQIMCTEYVPSHQLDGLA